MQTSLAPNFLYLVLVRTTTVPDTALSKSVSFLLLLLTHAELQLRTTDAIFSKVNLIILKKKILKLSIMLKCLE